MAATTAITSYHGAAAGTSAVVAAVRFKLADNDTADTSNRIPIPGSGTQYSYLKHLALTCSTSPSTLIDTITVWGDGGLPTGVQLGIRDNTYINPLTQTDSPYSGWTNNYTGYTSGSPLSLAGSMSNPSTGKIQTNYLQMQMGVTPSASAGVMSSETMTYGYLES